MPAAGRRYLPSPAHATTKIENLFPRRKRHSVLLAVDLQAWEELDDQADENVRGRHSAPRRERHGNLHYAIRDGNVA